jgi:hypothetical protein
MNKKIAYSMRVVHSTVGTLVHWLHYIPIKAWLVMHYFEWSGVLAIRTMQCIPMLFLYYTLHLYYTPVGLLARLLILLLYVDLVCWLRWQLSSSLLMSSSSCTAAMLTDWIVFLFLLHATPPYCFILFLNSISNLCPSLDSQSWCTSSCSWL